MGLQDLQENIGMWCVQTGSERFSYVLRNENWIVTFILFQMKKKFRKYDVEVGKDFQFESLDGVIQETDKILASYVYAVNGNL